MAQTVLFHGKDQVLQAYELNDVAPWGIWSGKELVTAYDADDVTCGVGMLSDALDMLASGGSEGVLILRVYDPTTAAKGINYATPALRGFTFKLHGDSGQPWQSSKQMIVDLQKRNALLEQALLERAAEDDEDEEDEEGGIVGAIKGILTNPEQMRSIIGTVTQIVGIFKGMRGQQPAQVSGVAQPFSPDQQQKTDAAIDILEGVDPLLGDHLQAIAKIAVEDPQKYAFLISMLPK
jgi:hypothetical protein